MSAPQLLQANPALGATAYVNQVYPVDAVSKLVQIPDTKRIAKIVGTPVVGQALLYSATAAGTVESPDTLAFTTIGSNIALAGAARKVATAQTVLPAGTQLQFTELAYDNSGGQFGNFNTYFALPALSPAIYLANCWASISMPSTTATFDLYMTIGIFNPVTSVTTPIGSSTVRVSAPAATTSFRIGCSGQGVAEVANSTLLVTVAVNNAVGAPPALSCVDGQFQIVSGLL